MQRHKKKPAADVFFLQADSEAEAIIREMARFTCYEAPFPCKPACPSCRARRWVERFDQ